jgi:hypothetical protein
VIACLCLTLKSWPEYSAPLGEPLGDAEITTTGGDDDDATLVTTYSRTFKTGTSVFVNITMPPTSTASAALLDKQDMPDATTSEERYTSAPAQMTRGGAAGLGSQVTTTCIRWSDGTTSGNGCGLFS